MVCVLCCVWLDDDDVVCDDVWCVAVSGVCGCECMSVCELWCGCVCVCVCVMCVGCVWCMMCDVCI